MAAVLLAAGCAAQPQKPIMTATGRPEVTVRAPAGVVESELATMCAARLHGTVGKAEPTEVDCSGLPPTFGTALWGALSQSPMGGHTDDVAKFQIIDLGNGTVRILGSRELTAFNAFGGALSHTTWQSSDPDIEDALEAMKQSAEAQGSVAAAPAVPSVPAPPALAPPAQPASTSQAVPIAQRQSAAGANAQPGLVAHRTATGIEYESNDPNVRDRSGD